MIPFRLLEPIVPDRDLDATKTDNRLVFDVSHASLATVQSVTRSTANTPDGTWALKVSIDGVNFFNHPIQTIGTLGANDITEEINVAAYRFLQVASLTADTATNPVTNIQVFAVGEA